MIAPRNVLEVVGIVVSGQGVAQHYTREDWARSAFIAAAGIDPFPGTLNVRLKDTPERQRWLNLRRQGGILLPAPNPSFCDGRLFRASVQCRASRRSAGGAVVVPMVNAYPEDQLEIISAVGLRVELEARDGAEILVRIDIPG